MVINNKTNIKMAPGRIYEIFISVKKSK